MTNYEHHRKPEKLNDKESFMAKNADASNVTRRRFLAVAGSVTAASSLVPGKDSTLFAAPPPPPVVADHIVTIDVSDPQHIKYCTPQQRDAYALNVKANQTINWVRVKPLSRFHLALLFPKTPFVDANGPVHGFIGSQDDASQGKIGGQIAGTDDDYEYWVIVYDETTGKTYTHDPKIIVGKLNDAEKEIHLALDDLKVADEKLSDKPKLQEQIRKAEGKLNKVIRELKSQ
jgi:hypothetical protein